MSATYRERNVRAELERWVECCWSAAAEEPVGEYSVSPDGCVDILYWRGNGLRVVGTMTSTQRFYLPEGTEVLAARFKPGMAGSILEVSPAEFTDTSITLEALWGTRARELEARLAEAPTIDAGLSLLLANLGAPPRAPNPAQRAIEFIASQKGNVDLDFAARQANLSPRQFRRRCLEESGLTPKHLCRVLRFRHASELASDAPQPNWPGIAAEAGYFDQAHLIRDFREFSGSTPVSVFSNTRRG